MTIPELEAQRAARLDRDALPHTMTIGEVDAYLRKTADLDRRIRAATQATATLAALVDPDPVWRASLGRWRAALCDELLSIPKTRDPALLAKQRSLTLSIKTIDVGPSVLRETGYDVATTALGALMIADGFTPQGADPVRNFGGLMPWHGSLRDLDQQQQQVDRRRAQAQSALDAALQDDAERDAQDADSAALRDAFNKLIVKIGPDGRTLRAVNRRTNEDRDEATLTPLQRTALAKARKVFAEEQAARLAAALGE